VTAPPPPSDTPYRDELATAIEAARRAGDILRRFADDGVRYGWKANPERGRELVSEADLEADEAIHTVIRAAFPNDAYLSEEQEDDPVRLKADRVWIVDPLDGTREFLQGVPEYAVSIGLVVDGAPVVGAVYNPAQDELVAAAVGDGQLTDLSPAPTLAETQVLFGRGEWRWGGIPPLPEGTRVLVVGSIAYRMALLARGTGGLLFTINERKEWDIAAGAALVLAAGATLTDLDGDPLVFNKPDPFAPAYIAANPTLHAAALQLWRDSGWSLDRWNDDGWDDLSGAPSS
jgi:myo-inositol-1(or 4)-monophosphatase